MTGYWRSTPQPPHDAPDEGSNGASDDARLGGVAVAAFGFLALLLWRMFVDFFLGPSSEQVHSDCRTAVSDTVTHINYSSFPTQIFCETAADRYAGAIYPFWESLGLSSVFVVLFAVMIYGMWMIVRPDKTATQPARRRPWWSGPRGSEAPDKLKP